MSVSRRHLVVLSVMASPYQNDTQTYESQEDEEYLNDTIFSSYSSDGVGIGGGTGGLGFADGGGGGGSGNNIRNSLWNSNTRQPSGGGGKRKNVILPAVGKSRFLELPDLIEAFENQSTKYNKFQGKTQNPRTTMATTTTSTTTTTERLTLATQTNTEGTGKDSQEDTKRNGWITIEDDRTSPSIVTTTTPTTIRTTRITPEQPITVLSMPTTPSVMIKSKTTQTPTEYTTSKLPISDIEIAVDTASSTIPALTDLTATNSLTPSSSVMSTRPTTPTSTEIHQISSVSGKHQHHHNSYNGKSSRRHNGHHRQRKLSTSSATQRKHHHQHSGRRSGEISNPNMPEDAQDVTPLKLNRLDEFEYPSSGRIYEHRPSSYEELDFGRARAAIYPKSSTTISTTTRDSNIHIVKPEKLPEIVPSTPVSSNSKIIEIKSKSHKRLRREIALPEEGQVEIEPEYLVGDLNLNDSSEYLAEMTNVDSSTAITPVEFHPDNGNVQLDGFAGMLQLFFGIEKPIDVNVFTHPPSAEFVNLVIALFVWSVRYPAVFWTTAKSFATIFSVQMIATASDIVFSFIGISNLFKLQIYSEAQPVQNPGLILNATVTLALFLLSTILMLSSSMIMYLYGHGRLAAKMRDRSIITLKSGQSWIYFAHCASLCYVLALTVVKAPLLNDLSATYKHNLHCPTFMAGK